MEQHEVPVLPGRFQNVCRVDYGQGNLADAGEQCCHPYTYQDEHACLHHYQVTVMHRVVTCITKCKAQHDVKESMNTVLAVASCLF